MTERDAYDQLCAEYAASGDAEFSLQHVVDAYAAQHATNHTKPITFFFALVGLCLRVEKGYSGRQVQHVHQLLARRRETWPRVELGRRGGAVSALDVVAKPMGTERDDAVERWCEDVWGASASSHGIIRQKLRERGVDI